ncbi:MAG: molybdopterin-dependent oxidoreductase [Chloroflexi bacterium]|nr:molybdopterin-dependent oxidoreductase [Chloroflexota bacterium]
MSVDKFIFQPEDKTYEFLERGTPPGGWRAGMTIDRLVPTHCAFCGVQCAMYLEVSGNKVVGVEPRLDHPINEGRLCPKGVAAYQQVNHPDRLLKPLIRKNGRLVESTWDEALDLVVKRFQDIQREHGKDALAVYGGSSITTEKAYLLGKFARVGLGTRYVDYNGRLCMVAAASANFRAFGIDRIGQPYADISLADCLFVVGSNTTETFPVAIHFFWKARDRGAKLIVADPRLTQMARTADLHLPVLPGTDSALLNAILHVIIKEDYLDREFIARRTRDFDKAAAAVERYTPEYAQNICGVPAEKIVAAAHLWGQSAKAMLFHARGLEHHTQGTENCLAAINIVLATGKIGKPGCGYGTLTGQGNGQGGREHGQKCDQLPGQRSIEDPEARKYVAGVWGIPVEEMPPGGVSIVDMFELMDKGVLKGMFSLCNNSLVSIPNLNWAIPALRKLEFLVVVDFFLSETAALADVVLPGSVWAEDEGVVANQEGRVIKINKAVDPPGEARIDWQIVCDIARRLGKGQHFDFSSPRAIFDELRLASKGGRADYYGISYEKVEAQKGVFWPCPAPDHPGTPRLFDDRFYHADGRAIFHPIEFKPAFEIPDDEYPYYLTTGRVVYHYLSGNQTRRLGFLLSQAPEPWVEMHPRLAARMGIRDGDRARVRTRRGEVVLRALVARTIRPDTLFIPYHWGPPRAVNLLTVNALDPLSRIPEFKACAATVERAEGAAP